MLSYTFSFPLQRDLCAFYASVSTWFFGAYYIANSAASAIELYVWGLLVLCCGDVVYGLNIYGVGSFLGVVGIGLVDGSTLGSGVGFSGELSLWFLCGTVMSVSTLGAPPVFNLERVYVLGCAFSSCLVVGSLSLILLSPFGFY